jgi:metal-sulfur cluster biosynthetic enzyme
MNDRTPDQVKDTLRQVVYPGLRRDIVSFGFVRDVEVNGTAVTVTFAPNTTSADKVETMENGIRETLYQDGFALVQVRTEAPYDDEDMLLGTGTVNPLQMELMEEGIEPQPDAFLGAPRTQEAPAGPLPGETEVPTPIDGPSGGPHDGYDGPVPVFQWQVDPADESAPTAETAVLMDDWEFRVWWQQRLEHDLVYASLQAVRDDWASHDGAARAHPVGRTEAVNLVYDARREGIVAIYGTVQDFRPFVEAFRRAYGPTPPEHPPASEHAPTHEHAAGCSCSCGRQEAHHE